MEKENIKTKEKAFIIIRNQFEDRTEKINHMLGVLEEILPKIGVLGTPNESIPNAPQSLNNNGSFVDELYNHTTKLEYIIYRLEKINDFFKELI